MARSKSFDDDNRRAPARTSEAREMELASMAYDLAEDQIKHGTASSQVITHFLKAGSMRERLEQQRMEHEIELMEAKREMMDRDANREENFQKAIEAMRGYQGLLEPGPGDEF